MSVAVLGSLNMDLVVRASRLPAPGQTLIGNAFFTAPGGKGANQAVASARLDVPTRLIGCVGDDVFGETLRDGLHHNRVDTAWVQTVPGVPTGVALISVDDRGENTIVIVPGANGCVGVQPESFAPQLAGARVLLLQLEIPLPAVVTAARLAAARGVPVILDPAPACELPPDLYQATTILTPNESEASALVGFAVDDQASAARAAQVLLGRGSQHVLIKMGESGVCWASATGTRHFPAFAVRAIDTVAAGDAFNGALGAMLAEGKPLVEAIVWGLATAAVSVTRAGAQPSMPSRVEVAPLVGSRDT